MVEYMKLCFTQAETPKEANMHRKDFRKGTPKVTANDSWHKPRQQDLAQRATDLTNLLALTKDHIRVQLMAQILGSCTTVPMLLTSNELKQRFSLLFPRPRKDARNTTASVLLTQTREFLYCSSTQGGTKPMRSARGAMSRGCPLMRVCMQAHWASNEGKVAQWTKARQAFPTLLDSYKGA
jgi:hypothetical protein